MNQFDDVFKKKLNEEQSFDGRKQSWFKVNKNLHAYELGSGVSQTALTLWKVLGLVAMLSVIALVWDRQHIIQENKLLKSVNRQLETTPKLRESASFEPPTTQQLPLDYASYSQQQVKKKEAENQLLRGGRYAYQTALSAQSRMYSVVDSNTVSAVLPHSIKAAQESKEPVLSSVQVLATAHDSALVLMELPLLHLDSVVTSVVDKLDATTLTTIDLAPVPVVKPVRPVDKPWRVGVRAIVGFALPKERGVSAIFGQGMGVSYRVIKNLSLIAAVDFLKFDLNTDSIPRHFADVAPPPPLGPNYPPLKNIASNRVLNQYSLGLSYTLPLARQWSTSINLSHNWSYLPSRLVSYRFQKNPPHGGPSHQEDEYLTLPTPKHWVSNIWKMGIGLHFETPAWAFGVLGDYSKSIKQNKPTLEAVYGRVEAMYKF